MTDSMEYLNFEQALDRLREIVSLVSKKEYGLEDSIDLLEEGVHLANVCTENIDKTQWLKSAEGDDEIGQSEVS